MLVINVNVNPNILIIETSVTLATLWKKVSVIGLGKKEIYHFGANNNIDLDYVMV